MSNSLIDFFKKYGTEIKLTVNNPFVINDPNKIYFIDAGSINLSATKYIDNKAKGRLFNFTIFQNGEIFLGFNQNSQKDLVFLAGAEENSRIFELSLKTLIRELINNYELKLVFLKYLSNWIKKTYEGLKTVPKRKKQSIENIICLSDTLSLEPNLFFSTKEDLIWIESDKINLFLFQNQLKIPKSELVFFPIARNIVLKSLSKFQVSVVGIEELIADDRLWKGIDLFRDLILQSTLFEVNQSKLISEKWLIKRHLAIQKEFESSISKAREVLTNAGKTSKFITGIGDTESNIFNVCSLVTSSQGITLKLPVGIELTSDPIAEICRHSGIRYREVIFEDNWYLEKGAGNFLGFEKKTNAPVALISDKKKGYKSVNPVTKKTLEITKSNSGGLSRVAYSFYKPLPREKLVFTDLIKYSFNGLGSDLKRLFLTATLTTILALVLPLLTSIVFDEIIPSSQKSQILHIAYALFMAALGGVFFEISKNIAILRLRGQINNNLQSALWDRLLDLPTEFFKKFTAGDLAERSLGITQITNIFSGVTLNALISGIFSVLNFFLLFYFSVKLASITLLISVLLILVFYILGRKQVQIQKKLLEEEGKIAGFILQILNGISVLRVSGSEIRAFIKWFDRFLEAKNHSIQLSNLQNLQRIISSSFYILALMVIYYNLIHFSSGMTTGTFLAFNAAFGAFISAIISLSDNIIYSLRVIPIYNRIRPILEELPENVNAKETPGQLSGEIELNNIKFRYQDNTPHILNNVSMKIKKGEFVAFVGPSGSGKSTIIRLLLGFNQPEAGTILYDGRNLKNLDVKLLRKQIGVVLQDGSLIGGDIFSNIVGSSVGLTLKDAWDASEAAAFDKDIEEMPMGMFTIVNDEGGTLSGGQRQRLMIARALVHKPKILIFDEATSALDNRTQAIVTESLNKLKITKIVVAHRLSTIIKADKIFYLDGGQILEQGNYDELMNIKGHFYNLAKRQIE